MTKRATLVWGDVSGSASLNTIITNTGIGAIETALQAHSNGAILTCSEGVLDVYSTTPVNASYPLIETSALLVFADALGSVGTLTLPAPQSSIFMADNETVDPSTISDIITAAIGTLLAGSGNPVTVYIKGYLRKGRPYQ